MHTAAQIYEWSAVLVFLKLRLIVSRFTANIEGWVSERHCTSDSVVSDGVPTRPPWQQTIFPHSDLCSKRVNVGEGQYIT